MKRFYLIFAILLSMISVSVSAEGQQEIDPQTIVFGDFTWDSIQVHNRIMGYIIENGLDGYKADYILGDTVPVLNGIVRGDIDLVMESWHSNYRELYDKSIATGNMVDLGSNYPDGPQGWYIPRFLVEGPDALAPGLKSITDLPEYAHLFHDQENRDKGVIYGGVTGWLVSSISEDKFNETGLGDTYNFKTAGSSTALAVTMAGKYKKKEGWCGYYWEPSAALGQMDMVRLEGSEYEPAIVDILVNKSLLEKAPDVTEILKNYSTTVADNNEFLAIMGENGWEPQDTAEWFLRNKEDVWTQWVDAKTAQRVKDSLQ